MSTTLPAIPASLNEPLVCPVNRCNAPGTPLPPISPELKAILAISQIEHIWAGLRQVAAEVERNQEVESAGEIIRNLELLPPKLALRKLKELNESRKKTPRLDRPIIESLPPFFIGTIARVAQHTFDAFSARNSRRCCLHDFLDVSQIRLWRYIHRQMRLAPQIVYSAYYEPRPLFERIAAMKERGELKDAASWGTPKQWSTVVLDLRDEVLTIMGLGRTLQANMQYSLENLGYHNVLHQPTVLVNILSYVQNAEATTVKAIESLLFNSPSIAQLIRFCASPLAVPQPNPSTTPSSSSSSRSGQDPVSTNEVAPLPRLGQYNPLRSSLNPPLPLSSLEPGCDKNTDFDRFEEIANGSGGLPMLHRIVPPRFCPPDRCSGRKPVAARFGVVDEKLREIFVLGMERFALSSFGPNWEMVRSGALVILISELQSLECSTLAQRNRLLPLVEKACKRCVIRQKDDFGGNSSGYSLNSLRELLVNANQQVYGLSSTPCLCDLTHLAPYLDQVSETLQHQKEVEANDLRQRSPTVRPKVIMSLEQDLQSRAACFAGDWREKVATLVTFLDPLVRDWFVVNYRQCNPRHTQMSSLISSAQILEEVGGFPKGRWHAVLHLKPTRFFDDLLREDAYGAASEYMKGLADECHLAEPSANGKRPTPMETLRKYQYITFLDPTNSEARLNAASLRLVLADDRDNVIHWTRAIYDCTAALYYGPPSWKAHYRRGYALAHLKLWDKAIKDYKRALVIEPGNVRLKQCMDAAKRRVAVE